ncbi:Piso0_004300 [Millerozyma farinosa CBS 7064]|uniref:Piso0_004300 protein n=1 Tax=Pichia sorbitophila (strain ATCC MYA-4447 / BCRC 22081 / CBS 7064 / NBRC 10061 / NRRL Y-12695) TaxID=559304 RepID=G8Y815_PICSO|nr:Piso0_004300 [Millerozyma farinosa CBS 7064]CCE84745.1 Piso0_004300 [Millerozyma farinosa CBS 7064]
MQPSCLAGIAADGVVVLARHAPAFLSAGLPRAFETSCARSKFGAICKYKMRFDVVQPTNQLDTRSSWMEHGTKSSAWYE